MINHFNSEMESLEYGEAQGSKLIKICYKFFSITLFCRSYMPVKYFKYSL